MENNCCISGVRGAAVAEPRNEDAEFAIDRQGGDYKEIAVAADPSGQSCKAACEADNKCRAWTYARPGYLECRALLSETPDQAAAAKTLLHLGRCQVALKFNGDDNVQDDIGSCAGAALIGTAAAHHGWGSYDAANPITVAGPIVTSKYENPHATITVKANDKAWTVTLAPTSRMTNRGAITEMVAVGKTSRLTVINPPSKRTKCAPSASPSTARPSRCADDRRRPRHFRRARSVLARRAIRQSTWLYMAANVGHILSLTVFAAGIAVIDLRMAGLFAATAPGEVLRIFRRVTLIGFLGMLLTGSVLFTAEASHVITNPVFQFKLALILLGLLNVTWFEYFTAPKVRKLKPLKPLPLEARRPASFRLGSGSWSRPSGGRSRISKSLLFNAPPRRTARSAGPAAMSRAAAAADRDPTSRPAHPRGRRDSPPGASRRRLAHRYAAVGGIVAVVAHHEQAIRRHDDVRRVIQHIPGGDLENLMLAPAGQRFDEARRRHLDAGFVFGLAAAIRAQRGRRAVEPDLTAAHLHAVARQADHALDPDLRRIARPAKHDHVAALG